MDQISPRRAEARIHQKLTPEINAIGTAVLATSIILLSGAQLLLRRRDGRR